MFKSVFTKYITVFMLIIAVSFGILAATVCSMVTTYSSGANEDLVGRIAASAAEYLSEGFSAYRRENFGVGQFNYYVTGKKTDILSVFESLVNVTGETILLVTDPDGTLLTTNRSATGVDSDLTLPEDVIAESLASGTAFFHGDFGGLLPATYTNCAITVRDSEGTVCGILVACSSSLWIDELIEVILKTVIMSSLWVLIAALIAVYYLTERVIGPLRGMRSAAKSFSTGHFDVRVSVRGHDEVAELAQAFNNMAGSLEKLEDLRSTFLANVSHDLRTPMTTISGFVDGILDGTIPPERQNEYLEIISTEVKRLSRLVSTLLDISRIQAGDRKFVPAPFDICEMGRQILISFEQKIDKKRLDVEFETTEERMMVFADRDAIYQVFYNLCDNAVKFSREGGRYRVAIEDFEKKVRVTVYNEGEGIPAEDVPFVFDRFYKSDKSRGLDKSGAGLGLFIAKTIMNSHGQDLTVESVQGEYCCFRFTLAYATAAQQLRPERQKNSESEEQK